MLIFGVWHMEGPVSSDDDGLTDNIFISPPGISRLPLFETTSRHLSSWFGP